MDQMLDYCSEDDGDTNDTRQRSPIKVSSYVNYEIEEDTSGAFSATTSSEVNSLPASSTSSSSTSSSTPKTIMVPTSDKNYCCLLRRSNDSAKI